MKRVLFIGQAPARPTSKHDIPGTYLHTWLRSIEFTDDQIAHNCFFFALTDTFPGAGKNGHIVPTKEQIIAHLPVLQEAITNIQPSIIVPVGKLAIAELLQEKSSSLENTIGKTFHIDPFQALSREVTCIPLSHPSGRSAWNHTHKEHVNRALQLLKSSFFE